MEGSGVLITEVVNTVRPPAEPCPQTARRRVRTAPVQEREIADAIARMMSTQSLPKKRLIGLIRDFLKEKQIQAVARNDIVELERLDKQKQCLNTLVARQARRKAALVKKRKLLQKMSSARTNLENIAKEWEERIGQCEKEIKEKMAALEEDHDREMQQFERNWADPVYLEPFNKPSGRLLLLRQREQQYAIARDFESAAEVKRQADALQDEETKLARDRAVVAMRLQFASIEMRQARELQCAKEYARQKVERLTKKRDLQLASIEQAINNARGSMAPRRYRQQTSSGVRVVVQKQPVRRPPADARAC